jgi:hypothetical protein
MRKNKRKFASGIFRFDTDFEPKGFDKIREVFVFGQL